MTYELCGDCLHARSSHSQVSETMMYCGSCQKSCDTDIFSLDHKPSGSIVQDGVFMQLKVKK